MNYQQGNVFDALPINTYTIYVRSKADCGAIDPLEVRMLYYPTVFTPNGDGVNDTWNLFNANLEPQLQVYVFDRFGKVVAILRPDKDWDGKYNGLDLPRADYWFKAILADGEERRGHFSLVR